MMTPRSPFRGRLETALLAAALALAAVGPRHALASGELTVEVVEGDAQDLYQKLADPQLAGYTLLLSGTYTLTVAYVDETDGQGAFSLSISDPKPQPGPEAPRP